MLSLSADATNSQVDLQVVNGNGTGAVALGGELMAFAEAIATRDEQALVTARDALLAAGGNEVVVDAAAVAANFQRMVRIADSTGIPVDPIMQSLSGSIQDTLDLRRFASSNNTPRGGALPRLLSPVTRFLATRVLGRGR